MLQPAKRAQQISISSNHDPLSCKGFQAVVVVVQVLVAVLVLVVS